MKKLLKLFSKSFLGIGFFALIIGLILVSARGQIIDGKLAFQTDYQTSVGSPFELSNTTSRYALTQAIVDNHTFNLTQTQARFASPDVVLYKGKFFSIFTPGVSFLAVPFYILGKMLGAPQLSVSVLNMLIALLNIGLVTLFARKLGAGRAASLASGLIFLFATNALPYSQTLTQHHLTIALILSSLILLAHKTNFTRNLVLSAIFGFSILVDIPNAIFFMPIMLAAFFQGLNFENVNGRVAVKIKLAIIGLALGVLPFAYGFVKYNLVTMGSPTLLAQSVGRTSFFSTNAPAQNPFGSPESIGESSNQPKISSFLPFNTRKELSGLYTLLVSDERSWLYYSPIVLLGILGLVLAAKKPTTKNLVVVASAVIFLDIIIYSSFGDPWGGWAFGTRYLLPACAILTSGIGLALDKFKHQLIFWLAFAGLVVYSAYISTLGVMSTNAIPPKVEAVTLPQPIPYTYDYNLRLIQTGFTSSLAYNAYFKNFVSIPGFVTIYAGLTAGLILVVSWFALTEKERKTHV